MSGGDDRRLRSSPAKALMLAALTMSLALGIGLLVLYSARDAEVGAPGNAAPLTDEQSRDQVVDAARQVVAAAQLRSVTGGYVFLSCANAHDPPYQATVNLNFHMPEASSVKRVSEIAAAMVAHGWHEAPAMEEHFGRKLTKDRVSAIFHQIPSDPHFGTMRIYGECRNMTDHRNDNPAWTEVTDQLG